MTPNDEPAGMTFEEAVTLAATIRVTPHCRVLALADRPFRPEHWRVSARYAPRYPNGRSRGPAVSGWVDSPAAWAAFLPDAIASNARRGRRAGPAEDAETGRA